MLSPNAIPKGSITQEMIDVSVLDAKQDVIDDLDTIREGAKIGNEAFDIITSMVNAGYLFAGIATPITDPSEPNAKVFYIANGKGTYEKFGGINVTEDEVVVLYWDSSWHKVSTGIASQEKLSELEDGLNVIGGGEINVVPQIYEDGAYVNSGNQYVYNSAYEITKKIALSEGDTIYVICAASNTTSVISEVLVEGSSYSKLVLGISGQELNQYEYTTTKDIEVAISHSKLYSLSVWINRAGEISKIKENILKNEQDIISLNSSFNFSPKLVNGYVASDDKIYSSPTRVCTSQYINAFYSDIKVGGVFIIQADYYDENKNRLGKIDILSDTAILPSGYYYRLTFSNYNREEEITPDDIAKNIVWEGNVKIEEYFGSIKSYTPYFKYQGYFTARAEIGQQCPIMQTQAYTLTSKISLKKGETIIVNAACSACVISQVTKETDESGVPTGTYICLVNGTTGSEVREYSYTSNADKYVAISCNSSFSVDIKIKKQGKIEDIVDEQIYKKIVKTNIIEVGTGKDYTDFVSAIDSIVDSNENNRYIVKVYEGIYETVIEDKIVSGYRGLKIPDYVDIIGVGDRDKIIIQGTLPSSEYAEYSVSISTINLVANNNVENVTIKAKNIRYCNHDDGDSNTMLYGMVKSSHKFKYVTFVYQDIDSFVPSTLAKACVGIGAMKDKEVVFENCIFITEFGGYCLLMHDNANAATQERSCRMIVDRCLFINAKNRFTPCLRLMNSGGNQTTYTTITNTKLHNGILIDNSTGVTTNKHKVLVSGCDNYKLTKEGNMVSLDLSEDVIAFCNKNVE